MSGRDGDEDEIFEILDDGYARDILIETRSGPVSADELSEVCDVSPSTVYRRVERLQEHDLLEGQQRLDPDGHHYEVYTARLQRVTVELTEDGFIVEIDRTEPADAADRFTELFEELSGE